MVSDRIFYWIYHRRECWFWGKVYGLICLLDKVLWHYWVWTMRPTARFVFHLGQYRRDQEFAQDYWRF